MNVLEEKVVTDAEARSIMDKRAKEKELKFEQQNAHDTLDKFTELEEKDAKELGKELFKISKLKDAQIAAIANFLPKDKDDLRVILNKDYTVLTEDEANLILDTVKKFA